nr:CoF synthetase [uncultured Psychroserpens sp.]
MIFNKLRFNAFWFLDSLKGGHLKRELNDVKQTFKLDSFSQIQKKSQPVLKNLLDTAVEKSKFYNAYSGYNSLDDFPVTNKLIVKKNIDTLNIIPKTSPDLIVVSSSGSTGIPFQVYKTKRKLLRSRADLLYFANSVGYNIGDQLLFIRLWLKKYKKSSIVLALQNQREIDVEEDLNDKSITEFLSKIQKDKQPKTILGYVSGLQKICTFLDKIKSPPLQCNIKTIIATSENLYDSVREKTEYYFNAPVVSRYSNEENGIVAQQMVNDTSFTINWASFYVEILDLNEDKPAKPGELGRIVITDFFNLATPLIRYDTGDLGSFCNYENDSIPKFKTITGRKRDILYNTKGDLVNPSVVFNGLTKFPQLIQFQVIQESKKAYTFKINIDSEFTKEKEIIDYFKSYLGEDADITIKYIDEIPLLSSGKRRLIINLYDPDN